MNTHRTLALALSLSLGFASSVAAAQDAGRPQQGRGEERCGGAHGRGHGPGRHLHRLKTELGLDDNQVALIREAFQRSHEERQRIRQMERGSDQQRSARQALRQRMESEIDAVLTPAQRTRFEQLRAQLEARRGERGARGPRGGARR